LGLLLIVQILSVAAKDMGVLCLFACRENHCVQTAGGHRAVSADRPGGDSAPQSALFILRFGQTGASLPLLLLVHLTLFFRQFLSFLVIDVTGTDAPLCLQLCRLTLLSLVTNLAQIFGPILLRKVRLCCGSRKTDEQLRPEFDLSEQFLSVLYRQFILYVGILVFPLLGNALRSNLLF
jgi:hypothetical protein